MKIEMSKGRAVGGELRSLGGNEGQESGAGHRNYTGHALVAGATTELAVIPDLAGLVEGHLEGAARIHRATVEAAIIRRHIDVHQPHAAVLDPGVLLP